MVKTEAIILKSADLGEADRLLTIYSKEFGKIQVIARGAKKLESKLRCHLEPFSYSHLILIEGKNFKIVKDAVLIEKMKPGYKIVNLIDELIIGEEKDEEIWELILETFKKPNFRNFQDNLLRLLGYDPKQVKDIADIY